MKTRVRMMIAGRVGLVLLVLIMTGCTENDNDTLAPYTDQANRLSNIVIQDASFLPKVTWVGGYVTVFGLNRGMRAALDSSLAWVVTRPENTLPFPVTIGQLPAGAEEQTAQFGGHSQPRLIEDSSFTFWVMTGEAWSQVLQLPASSRHTIIVDSTATALVHTRNDTVFVSPAGCAIRSVRIDVYINISEFKAYGRLAVLSMQEMKTSNQPVISWTVTTAGTDTLISAIGIVRGQSYDASNVVWEMISAIQKPDTTIYWVNNVIASPLAAGTAVASTQTFTEYPAGGLERGYTYLLWIANKNWDRENRLRSTPNYAYALFNVW